MDLDINTDWVQFSVFNAPLNTPFSSSNENRLMSSMVGTPSRYFASWWTRDFFTMSLRRREATTSLSTTTAAAKPKG